MWFRSIFVMFYDSKFLSDSPVQIKYTVKEV